MSYYRIYDLTTGKAVTRWHAIPGTIDELMTQARAIKDMSDMLPPEGAAILATLPYAVTEFSANPT